MSHDQPVRFIVTSTKKCMEIEWRLPGIRTPADCLYWAYDLDAKYDFGMSTNRDRWLHFQALSGTIREYRTELYWGYGKGLNRSDFTNTHYLIHHGLDGLPRKFFETLPRDEPIIEVLPFEGGFFRMTLDEWFSKLESGSPKLSSLAISRSTRR